MNSCAHCTKKIRLWGFTEDGVNFCDMRCYRDYMVAYLLSQIADSEVSDRAETLHKGPCPVCGGKGPNDAYCSYWVWSLVAVCTWGTRTRISCRRCAMRRRVFDAGYSALLGWWCVPWGILCTIMQLLRNSGRLRKVQAVDAPSLYLSEHVRYMLMEQRLLAGELTLDLRPLDKLE